MIRLSKLMSQLGICSRREADDYISRGLVKVDGKIINQLGTKVSEDASVELLLEAQKERKTLISVALHKPRGFVSSQPEDGYKAAVELVIQENYFGKEDKTPRGVTRKGLAPLGRLDIDSTGLLILSQDGTLAKKIIGEDSGVEKEYQVYVSGEITEEKLELLRHGISLDEKPLKKAQVYKVGKNCLTFILTEGKKRQIRRMCEFVHLKVTRLTRVRIGNLKLGNLPEGKWKFIKSDFFV